MEIDQKFWMLKSTPMSIKTLRIRIECHYAHCIMLIISKLNYVLLIVIMVIVIILNVIMLNVIMLIVIF